MENELLVIEKGKELEFFTEGGLEPFLAKIKKKVETFEHDMTTKKGRDATRSFAHNIASFKQRVEEKGVELVGPLKKQTKVIDEGRKHSRDTLDALKAEARKPLTEWEEAEEGRIAAHRANLETLKELVINEEETSEVFAANLEKAKQTEMGKCWEEFAAEAATEKDNTVAYLETALAEALKIEAEAVELERLRKEQEVREQEERDEKLKKEAADEAREKAEAEAQEKLDKAEAAKLAAEEKADKADRARIATEERGKIEIQVATTRARVETKAEVEADKKADEEKQRKKEENTTHRGKTHKAAKESLMALDLKESVAVKIVKAIAAGEIANVSINY